MIKGDILTSGLLNLFWGGVDFTLKLLFELEDWGKLVTLLVVLGTQLLTEEDSVVFFGEAELIEELIRLEFVKVFFSKKCISLLFAVLLLSS